MKTYLVIILLSFALSLMLLGGTLDKDFFSYYYIGREAALHHKDFFRDFAENKGLGTYIYFTILYSFFRNHWMLALIFSNTVLDIVGIILTLIFVQGIRIKKNALKLTNLGLIIVLVLVFKACSIGPLLGGTYTTNVAYPFLVSAFILFQRKRFFWCGVLFGTCVLTRQSFIFFAPVFLTMPSVYAYPFKKSIYQVLIGGFSTLVFLLVYGLANHNLTVIYENMFLFAIHYANSENANNKVFYALHSFIGQPVFIAAILYCLIMLSLTWRKLSQNSLRLFTLTVFICSLIASFSAGVFYFHHFLQFMPIFALCLAFQNTFWPRFWRICVTTVIFGEFALLTWNIYITFAQNYNWYAPFDDTLIHQKKYLQIVQYYPRYYFDFNKSSPDRYFNSFFVLPFSNSHYEGDAARHAAIPREILTQTAFLFIDTNSYDTIMNQEYLNYYGKRFHLKKVSEKQVRSINFRVYESNKY